MSVVVKGMKMPKNFFRCPFASVGTSISKTTCRANNWNICSGVGIGDCPLVELPKHSRLIDSDSVYDAVERRYRVSSGVEHKAERDFLDLISDAPTIIEAEEG